MTKIKIKKIEILSFAKINGIVMTFLGLIGGLIFASISTMMSIILGDAGIGIGFGFEDIILFPIKYGIIGFIGGAIGALIFNLASGLIGGLNLEIEEK